MIRNGGRGDNEWATRERWRNLQTDAKLFAELRHIGQVMVVGDLRILGVNGVQLRRMKESMRTHTGE